MQRSKLMTRPEPKWLPLRCSLAGAPRQSYRNLGASSRPIRCHRRRRQCFVRHVVCKASSRDMTAMEAAPSEECSPFRKVASPMLPCLTLPQNCHVSSAEKHETMPKAKLAALILKVFWQILSLIPARRDESFR